MEFYRLKRDVRTVLLVSQLEEGEISEEKGEENDDARQKAERGLYKPRRSDIIRMLLCRQVRRNYF
jgi:hypothetical protein